MSDVYDKMEALVQKKGIRKIGHHRASGLRERVLTRYIMTDLKEFRRIQGNDTLGGMAIREASGQKRLYDVFDEKWQEYRPKPIKIKLPDGSCVVW